MQKRKLSADDTGILLLIAALIFGMWFRIMPAWLSGFPVNDGGMFYTMIRDLQANHYNLPLFTTYNNLNIPFVYPPLGFYLGAGISDLFKISPIEVIHWVPGIINGLCIPAFYFFAKEILNEKLKSSIATLVYTLISSSGILALHGRRIDTLLGALFMLLALTHIHRVFANESKKDIWGAIIFSSLAALSHTEAPIYTIAIAIYIWVMKSRSLKGLQNGILIAMGVLILSSPWLGWIIYNHGTAPLISASQTGFHSSWSALWLIDIDFVTEEPYLDLLGVLSIVGMAILVSRRIFFIPGMLLVIFLSHPRSAHTIGDIPLAMAAGVFVSEILLPAISNLHGNTENQSQRPFIVLLILIPYIFSNSLQFAFLLSGNHVSDAERTAMQWVGKNTPAGSRFLIITGETNPFCDATNEWFPSLTGRESLTTLQGREWLLGNKFGEYISHAQGLQGCVDNGADCITRELKYFGTRFNYVYISILTPTKNCEAIVESNRTTRGLILALEERATIFHRVSLGKCGHF